MPNLKTIQAGIAKLPFGPPKVVVLTGATTGIGSYIAQALARTYASHGSKLRVYIVGRKRERAEALFKFGKETAPGSDWRFVEARDLSLMADVDLVVREIERLEGQGGLEGGKGRVDVLYMSQALSPMQESKVTPEGLDTQLSLLYYSRIHLIRRLTPLLLAAPTPAHCISIFAGSMESAVTPTSLPIGTPSQYTMTTIRNTTVFMKTFAFEALAAQHAGKISFTHIYPGLVDGPVFYSDVNPLWFRVLWRVVKVLVSWYMTSPEVCGDVMVFLSTGKYAAKGAANEEGVVGGVACSTQRELGGGAYGVGQRGDENKAVSYANVRKEDTGEKVWKHTVRTLEEIEKKITASS
ncbi:NAD(P)-binding protein [Lentithecium fluviatile CBS 122367]|uniref:NAD(P)-binding protein n=1 Tax=Lentithecium fluviatile CBS 122367 TaxID=1168545 RepID=A0A6G1IMC2_9PLEO|nr:NAD(P)-binding protein [Lentithecium fluviatile CBS 122367]